MSRLTALIDQLSAPIIAAPMFLVSNPALALAVCSQGLIGSFPAHGPRDTGALIQWLDEMETGVSALRDSGDAAFVAPYAVNVVMHASNPRMASDLDLLVEREVPIVITSKSAPGDAVRRVHEYGGIVISDIATRRHAEKCAEVGVDAVVAVCAGAGGHTGRISPFALLNEIREVYDGVIVMAGGISTGRDVLAAKVMGADLSYVGTRFINTTESMAAAAHKQMILDSESTDIFYTAAMDGAPANFLLPSLLAAGIDPDALAVTRPGQIQAADARLWKDVWSAGHGVGAIHDIPSAVELSKRLITQYQVAREAL